MKIKSILAVALISIATSLATIWGYNKFYGNTTYQYKWNGSDSVYVPANYAGFENIAPLPAGAIDFMPAARAAIPATVHIKTKTTKVASNNLPRSSPFGDLFEDFFGERSRSFPQTGSGSGAIISEDGYIVTNNHVISGATELTVTLANKRSFTAKVIGADPSSDLAVIKIDANNLPFLLYGNSDEAEVGQWVLAVGYPLMLEATVTAGIISAKGRTLDINSRQSNTPVESFIQTDAAVNPGNSGGPLITTDGKLIGINSAIASPTGSYAGYSFTIPVNIVKKIVDDIIKYGTVQRAYLGIQYPRENISDELKKEYGIKDGEGVYVLDVPEDGAAKAAGIQKGDVITKVNNVTVKSGADMVGQIATYRPGDKISISFKRDGKEHTKNITLRNSLGTVDIVKVNILDKLGAQFETLSANAAKELGVNGGVVIKSIGNTGLLSRVRVQEGFVILKANNKEVKTVDEFRKVLDDSSGSIKVEGVYPGYEGIYNFVLNMDSVK